MIVMKFGGTSVESAEAIERIAGIVRGQLARRPVVEMPLAMASGEATAIQGAMPLNREANQADPIDQQEADEDQTKRAESNLW